MKQDLIALGLFIWALSMSVSYIHERQETSLLKDRVKYDSINFAYQISIRDSINERNIEINNSLVKRLTYIPHD